MRFHLLSAAAALSLVACGGSDPAVDSEAPTEPSADLIAEATPADPFLPTGDDADEATVAIPELFFGRWGLTPGDCDPSGGDDKGAMTIDAEGVRFFEARAVPTDFAQRGEDMIRADFRFTGEGQEWTREMRLELVEGGAGLKREEFGDGAIDDPLVYSRCPADAAE